MIACHKQELLKEARSRLEAAIGLVTLPPWPAAAVAASPMAAAFLIHRFGKILRLVDNIAAFDSLLPRAALMSMVFERIFQQQVCPSLSFKLKDSILLPIHSDLAVAMLLSGRGISSRKLFYNALLPAVEVYLRNTFEVCFLCAFSVQKIL